jgi:lysyl-tRNA synthetase class 2
MLLPAAAAIQKLLQPVALARLRGCTAARVAAVPATRRAVRALSASADGGASPTADPKPRSGNTGKGGAKPGGGGRGKQGGGEDAGNTSSAEDIRAIRLQKVSELRAAGQEPYGYRFDRTHTAAELQATHAALEPGQEVEGVDEAVAGRVMARRVMGKLAFLSLQDESGSIQLYCEKSRLGDAGFDALNNDAVM